MPRKTSLALLIEILAPLVFFIAACEMLRRQEPFYSWFYSFAWWSYILFLEAFLYRRGGKSDLFCCPLRFSAYLPLSITIWLVFELFNLRLSNWHYIEVPSSTPLRWLGYSISFATVLPGIIATRDFLDYTEIFKNSGLDSPAPAPRALYLPFLAAGALSFLLPLLWPQYFFPLVWGCFIFLLEPVNHRFGAPSLLADWRNGTLRPFFILLLAGACCGLLWELWNFWAGSKWVYTVPFVGYFKIFEMPVLGFLGFPPFAVECYVMANAFFLLTDRIGLISSPRRQMAIWAALAAVMALFDILAFVGIDRFTVITFRG